MLLQTAYLTVTSVLAFPLQDTSSKKCQIYALGKAEPSKTHIQQSWGRDRRQEKEKINLEGLVQEGGLKIVCFLKLELKTQRGAEFRCRLIHKKKGDEESEYSHWLSL